MKKYKSYFDGIEEFSFLIYKASGVLDTKSLAILYCSLCYLHIDYCRQVYLQNLYSLYSYVIKNGLFSKLDIIKRFLATNLTRYI